MLQLYDVNRNKIKGLVAYKDYCIESVLKTGDKTLSFLYPKRLGKEIKNEGYIRTKTDEFVIKSIDNSGDWITVNASLNVEDLEGEARESFTCLEETISKCLDLALSGTGWTANVTGVTKKRTVRMTNCNSWDIIQQARKTYLVEYKFDTINKIIYVKEKQGQDKGTYFTEDLNLRKIDINNDSYDFFTRIKPIGKDGLKINVNGKDYLENYQYSTKVKTLIWKDERYTVATSLLEDATIKLNELSKPRVAYKVDIIDLAKLNIKYKNILDYSLGDTIYLVSKENGIREKQRIVKIKEYPDEPERNNCEIANAIFTFEDIQKEYSDTTDTVNNITSDNGTVSENAIAKAVEKLTINKVEMNKFTALEGTVGSLTVNKLNVDIANIKFAEIDTAIAKKIEVTDLTAGNIKFEVAEGGTLNLQTLLSKFITGENGQFLNLTSSNVVIANAVIKDAMIENVSLNKLKAGTINTNTINLASADGGLSIVGPTMQFKDKSNRVRLQLGQDTAGDFNFILRAADGTTTLIDGYGIKEKAIADKLIKSNMVADNAIGEQQINYSSLVTGLNKDTNTQLIKASKVAIDLTGQSLEVSFNSLKSNVDSKESRNLALKTNIPVTFTGNNTVNQVGPLYNIDGLKIINKIVTVSFDFSKSEGATGVFRIQSGAKHWSFIIPSQNISSMPNRIIKTVIVPVNGDETFSRLEYRLDNAVGTFTISNFKVEFGENTNPVWTVAQEDIDSKIQANTTSITAIQGSIDTLVKDTKIEDNGTVVKLQDFYSIFKQTSKDISLKVESLETMKIGGRNLIGNSAPSTLSGWGGAGVARTTELVDDTTSPSGKAIKVTFTATGSSGGVHKPPFKRLEVGKEYTWSVWIKGNNSKQISVGHEQGGRKVITLVANTWTKYSNTFVATDTVNQSFVFYLSSPTIGDSYFVHSLLLQEGNKATDWVPAIEDTDSKITDLSSRMATAEINLQPGKITASVSNAINAGTSSITTTQFVMDTTGLTVKNGAIKIQNKAGTTVLSADVNGNLSYTGKISNIQDGYGVEVDQGGVLLSIGSEIVGGIRSSKFTANTAINGISIVNTRDGEYIDLGFTDSETFGGVEFTPTIRISKVAHELTGNFKGVQFYDNIRVSSRVNMFVSNLYAGTTSVGEPAGRYYHNGWCGSIEGTAKRISNLNVFYDSGWYGFATGSNGSPVQYWGVMLHLKLTDNDFMQLVIGTDNKMYTRCWVNNAWQSWVQR